VIGRPIEILLPERLRTHLLPQVGRRTAGTVWAGEFDSQREMFGLRRDGTEFPIELTLGAWTTDDGDEVYTGVVRDVSDRRELERYRRAQYAVASGLAGASTVAEAATAALGALGSVVGWPLGALWLVDADAGVLRCCAVWQADGTRAAAFDGLSRRTTLARGVGLPGRVWASAKMAWIDDVLVDGNFPRLRAAAEDGLHAAIGMPLVVEGGVVGVVEFFDHRIRPPSLAVMDLMATVGEQIGQVIQRHRAEERLAEADRELDRRRVAERHAQQINAHVIHHLVQASEALDRGDLRGAQREMRRTLEEAGRIVTDLGVRDGPGEP